MCDASIIILVFYRVVPSLKGWRLRLLTRRAAVPSHGEAKAGNLFAYTRGLSVIMPREELGLHAVLIGVVRVVLQVGSGAQHVRWHDVPKDFTACVGPWSAGVIQLASRLLTAPFKASRDGGLVGALRNFEW